MSASNWRKRPSARLAAGCIVAVGVVLLASLAVWYGSSEVSKYQREASEKYSEYSAHTYGPKRNACLKLAVLSQPDCIASAAREAREYERQEQDLVSQRVTAIWTALMGAAAITGMLLSVLGVYLVWRTFQATKKTAETAQDTLDHIRNVDKLRYEAVIEANADIVFGNDQEIQLSYSINNAGETVASNVHVEALLTINIDTFSRANFAATPIEIAQMLRSRTEGKTSNFSTRQELANAIIPQADLVDTATVSKGAVWPVHVNGHAEITIVCTYDTAFYDRKTTSTRFVGAVKVDYGVVYGVGNVDPSRLKIIFAPKSFIKHAREKRDKGSNDYGEQSDHHSPPAPWCA